MCNKGILIYMPEAMASGPGEIWISCPFLRSVILTRSSHNALKLAHGEECLEKKGLDKILTR